MLDPFAAPAAPLRAAGVARRGVLLAGGVSRSHLAAQLAANRWRALNDEVVALHNGPLTPEQARLAVWLSAAPPAALCGLTAAALWGLRGFDSDAVHVVVRRGARVLPVPEVAVAVHESRRFAVGDVATVRPPMRVVVERAVVDAAAWSDARTAGRIIAAAVQQRVTTPARLIDELAHAGHIRHARLLRLLLADLAGGAQALSEVEFMRFCRRHGLPRPVMNVRHDASGRRRYLDAELTGRGQAVVHVEVDGGVHLSLKQRWLDVRRDNALALSR